MEDPDRRQHEYWRLGGEFKGQIMSVTLSKGVDAGPMCRDCCVVGDFLCDFPVGNGKTCDAALCEDHANEVLSDIHYCKPHFAEYERYDHTDAAAVAIDAANSNPNNIYNK